MTLFEALAIHAILVLMAVGLVVTRCWNTELGLLIAGGPFAVAGLAALTSRPDERLPEARLVRR